MTMMSTTTTLLMTRSATSDIDPISKAGAKGGSSPGAWMGLRLRYDRPGERDGRSETSTIPRRKIPLHDERSTQPWRAIPSNNATPAHREPSGGAQKMASWQRWRPRPAPSARGVGIVGLQIYRPGAAPARIDVDVVFVVCGLLLPALSSYRSYRMYLLVVIR